MRKTELFSSKDAKARIAYLKDANHVWGTVPNQEKCLFQILEIYPENAIDFLEKHPEMREALEGNPNEDSCILMIKFNLVTVLSVSHRITEFRTQLMGFCEVMQVSIDDLIAESIANYKKDSGKSEYEAKLFQAAMPYHLQEKLFPKYNFVFSKKLKYADKKWKGYPIVEYFIMEKREDNGPAAIQCVVKNSYYGKSALCSTEELIAILDPKSWQWPSENSLKNYLLESLFLKIAEVYESEKEKAKINKV